MSLVKQFVRSPARLPRALPCELIRQKNVRKKQSVVEMSQMSAPQISAKIIQFLPKLNGDDLATILHKKTDRDVLLLTAICESLKTVPLRSENISRILNAFEKLNFVPSVEVLNVVGATVKKNLKLYKTRNTDLCFMFRYFSILARNPQLVVKYNLFNHPDLTHVLESVIVERIGRFAAPELAMIAQYTERVGLEELVSNFGRNEHIDKKVMDFFFKTLNRKFGHNAWKQFEHLLRAVNTDSTGWGNAASVYAENLWDDPALVPCRAQFPRVQLEEPTFELTPQCRKPIPKVLINNPSFQPDPPVWQNTAHQAYMDHRPQSIRRSSETKDALSKGISTNLRISNRIKSKKNRKLFKFFILAKNRL